MKKVTILVGLFISMMHSSCVTAAWLISETPKELKHDARILEVLFSPDSRVLVTRGDNTAKLWEVESGKLLQDFNDGKANITSTENHWVVG